MALRSDHQARSLPDRPTTMRGTAFAVLCCAVCVRRERLLLLRQVSPVDEIDVRNAFALPRSRLHLRLTGSCYMGAGGDSCLQRFPFVCLFALVGSRPAFRGRT